MSKLNYILEELLFESRRKDVIEKYRDRLTDTLNDNPTPINGGNHGDEYPFMEDDYDNVVEHIESELPHPKYLEFVLNSMCCGGYGLETEQVLPLIQNFHRLAEKNLIKNKDIYSKEYATSQGSNYVDLSNVYAVVEKATEEELSKEQDKVLKGQRDIIYDGPRWRVVVPKSHEASCAYGSGTKWCTTSRRDDSNYKQYTTDAVLFYLIDKSTPTSEDNVLYKAALNWLYQWDAKENKFYAKQLRQATLYDSKDNTVRLEHVLPLLPEDMIMKIRAYYDNSINIANSILEKETSDNENVLTDLQEKFISDGVVNDLMSLNNHTGEDEESDDYVDNPIYNGFVFGNQEMSGNEQFLDLGLHDDNGNVMDEEEYLMDYHEFWRLYGKQLLTGVSPTSPHGSFLSWANARRQSIFNLDKKKLVNYLYTKLVDFIVRNSWKRNWDKGEQTYFDSGQKAYWVPNNSSSTFTFKYPPRENTLINKFINYIKNNPGTTAKEFYKEVYDFDYYSGYNTQFWGSIKDSGIVKTEKGPYGVLKYYIGPNYKKWTEGNLERYREQSRPWRWKR